MTDPIVHLAEQLLAGELTLETFREEVTRCFRTPRESDLGETVLDLDRTQRCGFPEVIYGEGKSAESIIKILDRQLKEGVSPLVTRVSPGKASQVMSAVPGLRYNCIARVLRSEKTDRAKKGFVAVISAGTSDRPVAEEAWETADWTGAETLLVSDVGVAGPHRLQARIEEIRKADAVVVAAGMEGALPSVVGGYLAVPVVAVPTSVGYGTAFGGITPLLGMLNSCASNVTVVNIDAGFKAGYVAGLIARRTVH